MKEYLDIKKLKQLIRCKINPNENRVNDFLCEIENELLIILRKSLTIPEWTPEHFLALVSGFLYLEIYNKQNDLLTSFEILPDKLSSVFQYQKINYYDGNLYLFSGLPSNQEELKKNYQNCYLLIKNERNLCYINQCGEPIPLWINPKKLEQLIRKHKNIDETRPLSTMLESKDLKQFYELITLGCAEKVLNDITDYYNKELKKVKSSRFAIKTPAEWLSFLSNKNHYKSSRISIDNPYVLGQTIHSYFVEGVKVDDKMKKLIIYKHFSLEEQKAESGLDRPKTKKLTEATECLSQHLDCIVTEQDVLDYCVQGKFDAYVNKSAYFKSINNNRCSLRTINDIENRMAQGMIDKKYEYFYDGLTKLQIDGDKHLFDGLPFQQSIKYLRDDGKIEISKKHRWLNIQLSLSEWVQGINNLADIKADGLKITRNDLLFVEDELILFSYEIKNSNQENSPKSSSNISKNAIRLTESHHADKRAQILRSALAVVFKSKDVVSGGTSIFEIIEKNVSIIWEEQKKIPLGKRKCCDLINRCLNGFQQTNNMSEKEIIFGYSLSLMYNEPPGKISPQVMAENLASKILSNTGLRLNATKIQIVGLLEDALKLLL